MELERRAYEGAAKDTVTFCRVHRPKVLHPKRGLVTFVPYPYEETLLNHLDAGGSTLAHKPRQTGISTTVMIQRLRMCLEGPGVHLIVSAKAGLAAELIKRARTAATTCDPPFPLKIVTDNAMELAFDNGARIVGEGSTPDTGRTHAATSVVLDEVRALPYPDEMWQSLAPTVTEGLSIVMISTPDIQGSFYHGHWENAQASDAWDYHEVRWQEHPEHDDAWAAETKERLNLTDAQWGNEYDLEWGHVGDAVFNKAAMEQVTSLGKRQHILPAEWHPGYAAIGGDLSGGGRAETVVLALDCREKPFHVVNVDHSDRWSAAQQRSHIVSAHETYNATPYLDRTGVGWAIISDLDIPNVGVLFTGGDAITEPPAGGINVPRGKLYANAAYMAEQGQVAVSEEQFPELVVGMRSITWEKTGQHLDQVDALVLALWGATRGKPSGVAFSTPDYASEEAAQEDERQPRSAMDLIG